MGRLTNSIRPNEDLNEASTRKCSCQLSQGFVSVANPVKYLLHLCQESVEQLNATSFYCVSAGKIRSRLALFCSLHTLTFRSSQNLLVQFIVPAFVCPFVAVRYVATSSRTIGPNHPSLNGCKRLKTWFDGEDSGRSSVDHLSQSIV